MIFFFLQMTHFLSGIVDDINSGCMCCIAKRMSLEQKGKLW